VVRDVVRNEGARALYTGLSTMVVVSLLAGLESDIRGLAKKLSRAQLKVLVW
jgi:hypothetical protein